MELIKKEKVRSATFHWRKNCLKKKVYELATLCDIKAMVIIYGPKQVTSQTHPFEPEIVPDNRDEVLKLIDIYKGQSSEDRKSRTSLLPVFFKERNKKARQVLAKLRDANVQAKYPTWDSRLSSSFEEDLRRIALFLEDNIEDAKAKLEQIKANNNTSNNTYFAYLQQQRMLHQTRFTSMPMPMQMPIQQRRFQFIDHYQDQRMVIFDHDYISGLSNIVYNAHPSTALCNYSMMRETVDTMGYVDNLAREPKQP